MSALFHESHRSLQRRFDSERLADRIAARYVLPQGDPARDD
jgi:hypothetical protein